MSHISGKIAHGDDFRVGPKSDRTPTGQYGIIVQNTKKRFEKQ